MTSAITPDGPRGPRYKLSPGVILLSQHCQVPLMPLLFEFSSFLETEIVGRFAIPKPFSRVDLTILPLIQVPPTKTREEFEVGTKAGRGSNARANEDAIA